VVEESVSKFENKEYKYRLWNVIKVYHEYRQKKIKYNRVLYWI
jgi:hypothetical protein